MKLDFIPLGNVPTAESLGASAKVLVVDGGEIKKTAKANVGEHPSGKLTITGTSEVNCAAYATAQVVDSNLIAGNIKKDVSVLGITGEYEGGGGSSDFSTAEITLNLTVGGETITQEGLLEIHIDFPSEEEGYGSNRILAENHKVSVLMYHGIAVAFGVFAKVGEDEYVEIDGVPTTTGGVTWDTENYCFLITGDGTITATVF